MNVSYQLKVLEKLSHKIWLLVSEIPHGWMMVEADATNLVQTRNYHKAQFKRMRVTI